MIVVRLSGGLGNQMFQYAFAKSFQMKGRKVYLDLSEYKNNLNRKYSLDVFGITIRELPKPFYKLFYSRNFFWFLFSKLQPLKFLLVEEDKLSYDEKYLLFNNRTRFFGYFQNEKYFKSFHNYIREDFQFNGEIFSRNTSYRNRMISEESVAIHVRRGDFAVNPVANRVHGVLSIRYYEEAIEKMNEALDHPSYFVFTDDKEWVKNTFSKILLVYTLVEGNDEANSWQDLYLMSACKHNIMANSSFSWWASWLNNNDKKIVIAPKSYCADPKMNLEIEDLIPREWIRI